MAELLELVTRGDHLNNKYGRLGPIRSKAEVRRVLEVDSVLGQRMVEVQHRLEVLAWRDGEEREGSCQDCRVTLSSPQKRCSGTFKLNTAHCTLHTAHCKIS